MTAGTDSVAAADLVCANCGTPYAGNYCPHCGQDAHAHVPTVGKFLRELLEKHLGIEGRLPLTLRTLFLHPGAMTVDYLEGRRQRYLKPLQLYFSVSVIFFLGLMQVPGISVLIGRTGVEVNTEAVAESRLTAHTGFDWFDGRIARFSRLTPEQRDHVLRGGMVSNAPRAMLLLVPLFAGLLMVLYRHRHFGEHLLTALHFHSFAFLLLLPGLVPWPQPLHDGVNDVLNLVLAVYLFLMLKRIYGGGRIATLIRTGLILAVYAGAIAGAALTGVAVALG